MSFEDHQQKSNWTFLTSQGLLHILTTPSIEECVQESSCEPKLIVFVLQEVTILLFLSAWLSWCAAVHGVRFVWLPVTLSVHFSHPGISTQSHAFKLTFFWGLYYFCHFSFLSPFLIFFLSFLVLSSFKIISFLFCLSLVNLLFLFFFLIHWFFLSIFIIHSSLPFFYIFFFFLFSISSSLFILFPLQQILLFLYYFHFFNLIFFLRFWLVFNLLNFCARIIIQLS